MLTNLIKLRFVVAFPNTDGILGHCLEKKKKSVSATSGTDKICLTHILADFAKSTGKSEESCFCLYVMVRQFCIFML